MLHNRIQVLKSRLNVGCCTIEINCKTSSVTTLLITEFDGAANGNTDKYKTSSITTGQINNTMAAMNKRIPKTTELVKKAIISYFCSASN